jgi:flavodoxin/uncharacterized protein YhbP (UPF0306 family)
MVKTLIMYESHSGFTEKIANQMALILGPALCSKTAEFTKNLEDYDFIILCTPGHSGFIDQKLLAYVTKNSARFSEKRVVLLCTCLDEEDAYQCLEPLRLLLGHSVVFSSSVQEEADNQMIRLALEIKKLRDENTKGMDSRELDKAIDDFILRHNTCALATGHENSVRATPIEYVYMNGFFYFMSEGGEKFSNLILNSAVSLCIYDEYKGMTELGGMQITGEAKLVGIGSAEYLSVLDYKKISLEKLLSLPIAMNMIRVSVKKIEFLNSAFAKQGSQVKQIKTL